MNINSDDNTCAQNKEIRRGDVFYMTIENAIGNEMQGTRPCVVVSNNAHNKFSQLVTVVPLTSSLNKKLLPTHVHIKEDYLPTESIALCEHVQTISCLRLLTCINRLEDKYMREIEKALMTQLGISTNIQEVTNTDTASTNKLEELQDRISRLKLKLIKAQERAQVYKELYDEAMRGKRK